MADNAAAEAQHLLRQCWASIQAKDFSRALQIGQRVLVLSPANADARQMIGTALLGLDQFGKAVSWLEQAASVKPNDGLCLWQLAQALRANGEFARALGYYERARLGGITESLLEQHRYEAALAAMQVPAWHDERVQSVARQAVMSSAFQLSVIGEATLASPYFTNLVMRRSAENHARFMLDRLGEVAPMAARPPRERIRLGFVGSDFR